MSHQTALKEELAKLLEEKQRRYQTNKINTIYFQDHRIDSNGQDVSREKYKAHLDFFKAGATFPERAFIAGNRCFGAGSKVTLFTGKQKNIEDVVLGDEILAYDKTSGALVPSVVINTSREMAENVVSFNVGRYRVVCTDDHEFLYLKRTLKERSIKDIMKLKRGRQLIVPHKLPEIIGKPLKQDFSNKRAALKYRKKSIKNYQQEPPQEVYCVTVNHPDNLILVNGLIASNCGKTIAGAYEMVCHLTGIYPDWWEGKRFYEPVKAWAVGKKGETVRDVLQYELLGRYGDFGTGMLPKELILKTSSRPGIPNAVQDVFVQHISGGVSELSFKSYDQEIDSFMGTSRHVVWHDEECKNTAIYSECLTRTMTVNGIIFTTFTPLLGLSPVVLSFLPGGKFPPDGVVRDENGEPGTRFVVNCDWDNAPHLTAVQKKNLLRSYSPYEREARSRGVPALGSGAVYPVFEEDIVVDPFPIPSWYKRAYGLDFGWNRTAAVWGAQDPDTGIIYLHSEYYLGKLTFPVHASAIKERGEWLMGACDPAGGGVNQSSGISTIQEYENLGLDLYAGHRGFKLNSVEPGVAKVLTMLETGKLKVFRTLHNWLNEFRVYRREETGRGELEVVKRDDHLMDATRYLIYGWDDVARAYSENEEPVSYREDTSSKITGY